MIKAIEQLSNETFQIDWVDGQRDIFKLADLQRNCPCIRCRDEKSGQMIVNPAKIACSLKAVKIENVGRYALKITFASGCSRGIYTFDFLRSLAMVKS